MSRQLMALRRSSISRPSTFMMEALERRRLLSSVYSVQINSPGEGVHGDAYCSIIDGQLSIQSNYNLNGHGVAVVVADSAAEAVRSVVTGSVTVNLSIAGGGYTDWVDTTYTFDASHTTTNANNHQNGVAFYISADGSRIGLEDMASYPDRADWDWATEGVDDYWNLTTTKLTAESITGTIGSQSKTSTDNGFLISDENVFAVPQSGGSIELTANNFSSTNTDILQRVHWAVVRNSQDSITGINPGITPNSSDPLKASLAMNAVGSFNVILYVDADGSGGFNAGEQLKVFHIAEVSITLDNDPPSVGDPPEQDPFANTTSAGNAFFEALAVPQGTQFNSGQFNHGMAAFEMNYFVILRGGGYDKFLGVDQIHLGIIQNLTEQDIVATFSDNHTESYPLMNSTPLLDTGNQDAGAGGDAAFPVGPTTTTLGGDPDGGLAMQIKFVDSPGMSFHNLHPNTGSSLVSVAGTFGSFMTFIAAYSDDYNKAYAPTFLQVNWSVNFNFSKNNGVWDKNDSSVTMQTIYLANPTTFSDLGVVTAPPTVFDATSQGPTPN